MLAVNRQEEAITGKLLEDINVLAPIHGGHALVDYYFDAVGNGMYTSVDECKIGDPGMKTSHRQVAEISLAGWNAGSACVGNVF